MKSPGVAPVDGAAAIESNLDRALLTCGVPRHHIGARKNDFAAETWKRGIPFLHGKSLFVFGKPGRGKTHFAVSLLREKIRPNYDYVARFNLARFVAVPMLLTRLRAAAIREPFAENDSESELDIITRYSNVHCLVLDDLGAEKPTDFAKQVLTLIVDQRYGAERQTLVTSNLSLELLSEKLGDRIASRLVETCAVVELDGESKRVVVK